MRFVEARQDGFGVPKRCVQLPAHDRGVSRVEQVEDLVDLEAQVLEAPVEDAPGAHAGELVVHEGTDACRLSHGAPPR